MEINEKSRVTNINQTILPHSIGDFIDLSLVEILTLQFLLRHAEPVVRHTLYLEISQFLQSESTSIDTIDSKKLSASEKRYFQFLQNKKTLSTSSYYNNLSNLEKRGLIKSNFNKKGKVESIEITNLTESFLDIVLRHFVRFGVRAEYNAMLLMKEVILKKLGKRKFENILVVWLNDYVDLKILRIVYEVTDSMFILSKNDFSRDLTNNGMENVKFSSIYGDMIREPNDIFEMVFFPFYYRNTEISGLTQSELLKEAVRVTKPNGIVIITAQRKPSRVNGVLANRVLDIYINANQDTIYEIIEMQSGLKNAGLSKIDVFEYNGDLVGIGWVD